MKTPRQILFERHHRASPKLDAVRHNALASLFPATRQGRLPEKPTTGALVSRRSLVLSLRWHLAGMSAAWLVIACLNSDSTSASAPVTAKQNSPSPREVLMALRENRRQILELLDTPMADPAPAPQPVAPPRRSGLESTNTMA